MAQEERDEDAELMLRVKAGDDSAFEMLVSRHQSRVFNTVRGFLGGKDDAEDLAQDVFLALFRSASSYEPRARFTTYLYRLIANRCINYSRRRKLARWLGLAPGQEQDRVERFSDRRPGPEDEVVKKEESRLVYSEVARLPERQRLAVIYRYYGGMGHDEIAQALSVSVPAVKSLLHRALLALAGRLGGPGDGPQERF